MPEPTLRRLVWALAGIGLFAAFALFFWSPSAVARRERATALSAARSPGEVEAGIDVAASPSSTAAVGVRFVTAERDTHSVAGRVSGLLSPAREVTVSAEEDGAIREVLAEEHVPVEAGQVLVRLDDTTLRAAVSRSDAALIRTRAALELARAALERQKNLQKRDFTSAAELDRARNQERAAFAARAEAEASLAETRDRLTKTRIRAPFAGVVNWLDLEPGSYLQRGDRVAEILDLSSIEVEVGVSDRQVVALGVGDAVEIRVDVFPGERFPAEIARIGRSADSTSQSYPVEVRAANPGERLLPGMVADVLFTMDTHTPAIRIPRRATQREYELDYVFVLESNGAGTQARRRRVTLRTVPFRPELVEVTSGLEAGERVATSSVESLHDGLDVRVDGVDGLDGAEDRGADPEAGS